MPQPPHRLRNDLKCVEWDVKPCPTQPLVRVVVCSLVCWWARLSNTHAAALRFGHDCAPRRVADLAERSLQPRYAPVRVGLTVLDRRSRRLPPTQPQKSVTYRSAADMSYDWHDATSCWVTQIEKSWSRRVATFEEVNRSTAIFFNFIEMKWIANKRSRRLLSVYSGGG